MSQNHNIGTSLINTGATIPTVICKQKQTKIIVINRDTLHLHISSYLKSFVEWGTTVSLFIAMISMYMAAASIYKETMQGREIIIFSIYIALGIIFTWSTFLAGRKHYLHRNKSIETLMCDIEKDCPNVSE